MTLIRLITVIIRLRLADSKGVSRNSRRVWKRTKGRKEEKNKTRNERRVRSGSDNTISCEKWGMQTLPARCDSLPCHVCALIRGQKEPSPWCTRVRARVCVV